MPSLHVTLAKSLGWLGGLVGVLTPQPWICLRSFYTNVRPASLAVPATNALLLRLGMFGKAVVRELNNAHCPPLPAPLYSGYIFSRVCGIGRVVKSEAAGGATIGLLKRIPRYNNSLNPTFYKCGNCQTCKTGASRRGLRLAG